MEKQSKQVVIDEQTQRPDPGYYLNRTSWNVYTKAFKLNSSSRMLVSVCWIWTCLGVSSRAPAGVITAVCTANTVLQRYLGNTKANTRCVWQGEHRLCVMCVYMFKGLTQASAGFKSAHRKNYTSINSGLKFTVQTWLHVWTFHHDNFFWRLFSFFFPSPSDDSNP